MDFGIGYTWTPQVCRIIAVYRCWAFILPTFGGGYWDLGLGVSGIVLRLSSHLRASVLGLYVA